jgi:nicotinate-nucleotide pyrophosphorylase (carboxylating)
VPAPKLDPADIKAAVDTALAEDLGTGDITTEAVIPAGTRMKLVMASRQDIIVCGLPVAAEVFKRQAPDAEIAWEVDDGDKITAGTVMARLEGPAGDLLSAERTALNFLQALSGIATLTRAYVDRIEDTGTVLLDTRKTLPGLRALSKYATATGGATNHRMRLDNVQVECDSIDQVKEAIEAGADRLLLDNMPPGMLLEAVAETAGRVPLEASGGVTLETIRDIAETGVDFISVGAITLSAPAVDIGLDPAP